LRELRDEVTLFNELDCGSKDSGLGRFVGSEIIEILKKMRTKVTGILSKSN